jgi:hypothetical protein
VKIIRNRVQFGVNTYDWALRIRKVRGRELASVILVGITGGEEVHAGFCLENSIDRIDFIW